MITGGYNVYQYITAVFNSKVISSKISQSILLLCLLHDVVSLSYQGTHFETKLVVCHARVLNYYRHAPDRLFICSLFWLLQSSIFHFQMCSVYFRFDPSEFEISYRSLNFGDCISIKFIQEVTSEVNATSLTCCPSRSLSQ